MMYSVRLALQSAYSRRVAVLLVLISIAATSALLVALDQVRVSARIGFAQSVSGTDLIVGARDNPLSLMLYSVFRIGQPTQQLPVAAIEKLQNDKAVEWVVPLSLGDSFKGFPVVGTTPSYFQYFGFAGGKKLVFAQGKAFRQYEPGQPSAWVYEAVIGAEVAQMSGLKLGDDIALSHGQSIRQKAEHGDKPFTVVGILAPTGTPVDRSVHVSLEALEAIHLNWQGGMPMRGVELTAEQVTRFDLKPKSVTAMLVGLKNRAMVFRVKRQLESDNSLPMTAAMPGVVLTELWNMVGNVETLLFMVTGLVGLVSLLGLVSVMLVALQTRKRELMILRSIGASRSNILGLLLSEAFWVMLMGCLVGVVVALLAGGLVSDFLLRLAGLELVPIFSLTHAWLFLTVYGVVGVLFGCLPAWLAYRQPVQL